MNVDKLLVPVQDDRFRTLRLPKGLSYSVLGLSYDEFLELKNKLYYHDYDLSQRAVHTLLVKRSFVNFVKAGPDTLKSCATVGGFFTVVVAAFSSLVVGFHNSLLVAALCVVVSFIGSVIANTVDIAKKVALYDMVSTTEAWRYNRVAHEYLYELPTIDAWRNPEKYPFVDRVDVPAIVSQIKTMCAKHQTMVDNKYSNDYTVDPDEYLKEIGVIFNNLDAYMKTLRSLSYDTTSDINYVSANKMLEDATKNNQLAIEAATSGNRVAMNELSETI